MKHDVTRALFTYWNALRGERSAPERGAIDPTAIRAELPFAFILEIDEADSFPIRLAGTRVSALFGRDLQGAAYAGLFAGPGGERDLRGAALPRLVCDDMTPVVAGLEAVTRAGRTLALELLLLPLRHGGRTHARVLGCLTPEAAPVWYGLDPVVGLALRSVRFAHPPAETAPREIVAAGPPERPSAERRRHLFVYEGGRAGASRPPAMA